MLGGSICGVRGNGVVVVVVVVLVLANIMLQLTLHVVASCGRKTRRRENRVGSKKRFNYNFKHPHMQWLHIISIVFFWNY